MEGVSVIICCYNSARLLPPTLAHLANQKFSNAVNWEVILIDNASTDDTGKVAVEEWNKHDINIPIQVVIENTKGLSAARRRGIAEAKFNVLVFCDDDNWLAEDYVVNAFHLMNDNSIGAIGGIGRPYFETKEPGWFHYVTSYYALGDQQNNVSAEINNFRYLYGAGIVISKAAIIKLYESGFSNVTSGRIGKTLLSGEDTEISYALQLAGYKVISSNKLKFQHFLPAGRLKLSYLNKLIVGIGYSAEMLHSYKMMFNPGLTFPYPNRATLLKTAFKVIKCGIILFLPFPRYGKLFPKWRVFLFEFGRFRFHLTKQKHFQK